MDKRVNVGAYKRGGKKQRIVKSNYIWMYDRLGGVTLTNRKTGHTEYLQREDDVNAFFDYVGVNKDNVDISDYGFFDDSGGWMS